MTPTFNRLCAVFCASFLVVGMAGCGGSSDGFGPDERPTQVMTTKGAVRGVQKETTVSFLGIPYAAAPTGELRFRAPQARASWQGELDASKAGPACPQASQTTTEDCLYLNVWRPAKADKPLPVFVWIHGGGFTGGQGGTLDGSPLAKEGIVVVSINYRMGVLGYLAHPALETASRDSGNYGVQDSQAALRWVRDNIAQFGGDPNNVTLGGSSAGSMTTCLNSISPDARGLFHKQILSSGPCAFEWPSLDEKYAQEAGVIQALGCTGSPTDIARCLRSPTLTVSQLLAVQNAQPQAVLFPSVGGTVTPVQPRQAIGKMPAIAGYAAWELLPRDFSYQTALGTGTPNPQDTASYIAALTPLYGAKSQAIASAYPLSQFSSGNLALNRIEADYGATPKGVYIAICTDVRLFEIAKAVNESPLFAYEANDPNGGANLHVGQGNLFFPNPSLAGASLDVSRQQLKYWANFMRNASPNSEGLPVWPSYAKPTDVMQFVPGALATGKDVNVDHKCPFWNSIGFAN